MNQKDSYVLWVAICASVLFSSDIFLRISELIQTKPHYFSAQDVLSNLNPLIAANSSHYTWTGNHFIPPDGVQTFHPDDFSSYFEKRNTLIIGDSTGRRAYATLYGIMAGKDPSNIHVKDIDAPKVIDFNKPVPGSRQERCNDSERGLFPLGDPQFVCRDLHNATHSRSTVADARTRSMHIRTGKSDGGVGTGTTANDNRRTTGRFDFIRRDCYQDILSFFIGDRDGGQKVSIEEAFGDYDLVVVTMGIWEAVNWEDCKMRIKTTDHKTTTLTNVDKYDLVLGAMKELSSADLQVVFRTPGKSECCRPRKNSSKRHSPITNCANSNCVRTLGFSHTRVRDENIWELINHLKAKLIGEQYSETKNHNITVVDWGTVVWKRSFDDDRLKGDISSHYGLEARLLFAQQLLHELLASDLKMSHGLI